MPLKLKYSSIISQLDLKEIVGNNLLGLYQLQDYSYGKEQAFVLHIGKLYLNIYNAGDEIGLKIIRNLNNTKWLQIV